jgi:hypothetical protein
METSPIPRAGPRRTWPRARRGKSGGAIGFYSLLHATKTMLKIDAHEIHPDGSDPQIDTVTITK